MSRRATKGKPEYDALSRALTDTTPPCTGDPRFIAEGHEIGNADRADMATICGSCPLRRLCAAYGAAARPPAGYWAGHTYRPRWAEKKEQK